MQEQSSFDKITQLIVQYSDLTEEHLMQLPASMALIVVYHIIEHETYLTLDAIEIIQKNHLNPKPKLYNIS